MIERDSLRSADFILRTHYLKMQLTVHFCVIQARKNIREDERE